MKQLIFNRQILALLFFFSFFAHAGIYVVGGENNPTRVIHPIGYKGVGGELEITVSIAGDHPNKQMLEIPVKNVINNFNRLSWENNNGGFNWSLPFGYDVETVLLHEMGHCLGLGHINNLTNNFTPAGNGANGMADLDKGADQWSGSQDDIRGDDVNFYWFQKQVNNPFLAPDVIDSSNYSVDLSDLPASHNFAAAANSGAATAIGYSGDNSSVMTVSVVNNYLRRSLAADDVNTIKFASTGLDRIASTADDYKVKLVYLGLDQPADLRINAGSAFGHCAFSYRRIAGENFVFNSVNIGLSTNASWYYNQQLNNTPPEIILSDDSQLNVDFNSGVQSVELFAVDGENDLVSWAAVSQINPGAISLDNQTGSNISILYQAPQGFFGSDQITVIATDALGLSNQIVVPIAVSPPPSKIIGGGGTLWLSLIFLLMVVIVFKFKGNRNAN